MFRRSLPCFMPKATRSKPQHKAIAITSKGLQIRLHVKPNSRKEGINDVRDTCVYMSVVGHPQEGEANRDVLEFISSLLGFRKGEASIVHGQKSHDKVILVHSHLSSLSEKDQYEEQVRILETLTQAVGR